MILGMFDAQDEQSVGTQISKEQVSKTKDLIIKHFS
jgi:hypothetical protein